MLNGLILARHQVHVDKGMRDGQKITFRGEGNQKPGIEPGDVIVVLQQTPHEVFQRDGHVSTAGLWRSGGSSVHVQKPVHGMLVQCGLRRSNALWYWSHSDIHPLNFGRRSFGLVLRLSFKNIEHNLIVVASVFGTNAAIGT